MTALLALLVLSLGFGETATGQGFIAGELLVRFVPDSESARALRATRSKESGQEGWQLVADAVSRAAGVPLRVKQPLSGDWVTLSIDLARLLEQIAERLRRHPLIAEAKVSVNDESSAADGERQVLRLALNSEGTAKWLKDQDKGNEDEAERALVHELSQWADVPLERREGAVSQLTLGPDMEALTVRVVERLKTDRQLFEAVQLNYLLKPSNPVAP